MNLLELTDDYLVSLLIFVNRMFLIEMKKVKNTFTVKLPFMPLPEQVTLSWSNSYWVQRAIKMHERLVEERRSRLCAIKPVTVKARQCPMPRGSRGRRIDDDVPRVAGHVRLGPRIDVVGDVGHCALVVVVARGRGLA